MGAWMGTWLVCLPLDDESIFVVSWDGAGSGRGDVGLARI